TSLPQLATGGADFDKFTTSQSGDIDVTLLSAGPPSTIFLLVGLGTLSADGASCALSSSVTVITQPGSAAQIAATASAGTFCVAVQDYYSLVLTAISYTVQVVHH